MKAKPEKGIILLKLVEFADEEQEKSRKLNNFLRTYGCSRMTKVA